jgi:hypothetical protein
VNSTRVLLLLAAVALAGCGSDDAATSTTTAAPTTTVAATTTVASTTTTTAKAAAATTSTVAAAGRPTVVLEGGGLGFLVSSASIRHLEFASTDLATIRTALVNALGTPAGESDQECGSGPVHTIRWSALSAYVSGGTFSGWFVPEQSKAKLTTADGIGLGTTLATLKKAHPDVKVEQTSLGTEWSTGELGGTLSSSASTGKVTALFSGDACIAR